MKRDEIKAILGEGASEEQVTNLLNTFHNAEKSKTDEINSLKNQLDKFNDYDAIKKQLDDINRANMSEQEKLEEQKREIEKNLRDSRIIVNTAKAKEILAGEDISEEIINSLVDENLETTVLKASKMKEAITNIRDSVAKKTKEDLINTDLKPTITNLNQNEEAMTFEKFSNLSAVDQEKFITEHPEEFEKLS